MGAAYGSAEGEIDWAYSYIAGRYGTPAVAWQFWKCIGECLNPHTGVIAYKETTWY